MDGYKEIVCKYLGLHYYGVQLRLLIIMTLQFCEIN